MIIAKNILKNNKKYLKIILFLLLLGFLIGFLLTKKINCTEILNEIKNLETYLSANHINYILIHLLVIIILIISSITIIGLILFPIYFIYEGACISFNIITFTSIYKINGFIYGLFYNLITKAVFIILLIFIFKNIIKIIKIRLLNKNKEEYENTIKKNIKKTITYILFLLINDIIIYFFAHKILYNLLFIIK